MSCALTMALSSFSMNFAGSAWNSFTHPLQQSVICRPSCVSDTGSPIEPSFSPETMQVSSGYGNDTAAGCDVADPAVES
jgi:hypothetical protein